MPDLLSFSLQRKPFMKCLQTLALIPKSLVDPAPFILMSAALTSIVCTTVHLNGAPTVSYTFHLFFYHIIKSTKKGDDANHPPLLLMIYQ